jgi:hypothetical protein
MPGKLSASTGESCLQFGWSILRSGMDLKDRARKSVGFQQVFKKVHASLERSEQNKFTQGD